MTDYTKLVKALRCCATMTCKGDECKYMILGCHDCFQKLHDDAAAAIEELQAEQKKTVTQIFCEEQAAWEGRCIALMKQISDLQAKISELGESYSANLVAAQNAQPHWVSVFDDLPRHNAVVVVSDGKRSWDVGQYHFLFKADDRTIWWWKKHTTRKVLWWMYKEDALPEPPKEDA